MLGLPAEPHEQRGFAGTGIKSAVVASERILLALFKSAYGGLGPQALSLALPGPHPALSQRERSQGEVNTPSPLAGEGQYCSAQMLSTVAALIPPPRWGRAGWGCASAEPSGPASPPHPNLPPPGGKEHEASVANRVPNTIGGRRGWGEEAQLPPTPAPAPIKGEGSCSRAMGMTYLHLSAEGAGE
jgi:hypothetical protein